MRVHFGQAPLPVSRATRNLFEDRFGIADQPGEGHSIPRTVHIYLPRMDRRELLERLGAAALPSVLAVSRRRPGCGE